MRTPSIKQTLSWVPKRTSDISLYNEPLFSGHLYQADADTKISCIWLISRISVVKKSLLSGHRTELTIVALDYVLEIRTEVS